RPAATFRAVGAQPAPPAPHLGEHTEAIRRELGRSEAQIHALLASGAASGCSAPSAGRQP
ncbi:MAG: CoA transferase, partial [Burkholderiaceae bacterium]|nr:CoA transferase [Burkholderiaceae bacterium]